MSSENRKTLLVWDVDDVLNTLMHHYILTGLPADAKQLSYEEIVENPPHKLLGISKADYLLSLDEVRAGDFYSLPPRPEVTAFFAEHGKDFDHIILSAVPLRFMENSAEWVLHYFGDWIQNCLFIPSERSDRKCQSQLFSSKAEAVAFFGSRAVLIDDSVKNVEEVRSSGGRAEYFPAPWNPNRSVNIKDFLTSLTRLKNE